MSIQLNEAVISSPTAVRPFPLYNDALQTVFGCLSHSELHEIVQVSRQWHQLVNTMKLLSLSTECNALTNIPMYSAVARHIAFAEYLRLRSEDLVRLSSILPNLKGTVFSEFPWIPDDSTLILPHLLKTFILGVSADGLSPLLAAINHVPNLQRLSVHVHDAKLARDVDFSRLLPHRLPQLRTFEIQLHESSDVPEAVQILPSSLIEIIRNMSLKTINIRVHKYRSVDYPLYRLLNELTANESPCPLTHSGTLISIELSRRMALDRPLLQSIIKFPSLMKLLPHQTRADGSDIRLLDRLPNLTELQLGGYRENLLSDEAVVGGCRSCPQLRVLTLKTLQLDTKHLDAALSYLPELTSLSLAFCRNITSLAPLTKHGLPERLQELQLNYCGLHNTNDMKEYLLQLKQLEKLTIKDSFTEFSYLNPMPNELQELIRPESAKCQLPKLVQSVIEY